ncbi:unnamed protein product [Protopolystoma xenopodis]|uniref:Uncharacterized protein n=1 Tax=Protopolystoma xenopodis TaxID=117903 RepID=A0A3S4ZZM5_9PLAT|nr:unnamed protein product [Protopolystoma xenopodis]
MVETGLLVGLTNLFIDLTDPSRPYSHSGDSESRQLPGASSTTLSNQMTSSNISKLNIGGHSSHHKISQVSSSCVNVGGHRLSPTSAVAPDADFSDATQEDIDGGGPGGGGLVAQDLNRLNLPHQHPPICPVTAAGVSPIARRLMLQIIGLITRFHKLGLDLQEQQEEGDK